MRGLMIEELDYVSGGRAENSGNGNTCGGAGCGGSSMGGGNSGSGGSSNKGGGSSNSKSNAPSAKCIYTAGFAAVFTGYGIAIAAENPVVGGISGAIGSALGSAASAFCGNNH